MSVGGLVAEVTPTRPMTAPSCGRAVRLASTRVASDAFSIAYVRSDPSPVGIHRWVVVLRMIT
jgi:hypothetical protein